MTCSIIPSLSASPPCHPPYFNHEALLHCHYDSIYFFVKISWIIIKSLYIRILLLRSVKHIIESVQEGQHGCRIQTHRHRCIHDGRGSNMSYHTTSSLTSHLSLTPPPFFFHREASVHYYESMIPFFVKTLGLNKIFCHDITVTWW